MRGDIELMGGGFPPVPPTRENPVGSSCIMKICHIDTLTEDIKNFLCVFKDIHQWILLPKSLFEIRRHRGK